MISLVGITGPARHGKDTVGRMIGELMPAAVHFAFADKIKEFLVDFLSTTQTMDENKEGTQVFMFRRKDVEVSMLNKLHNGLMWFGNEPEDAADMWIDVMRENHPNFHEAHDGFISFTSSWRKLFQLTGTQWGRQRIHEAFWIAPFMPTEEAIVTDVRGHGDSEEHHDIEATSIIDEGGVVIRVVDPRKGSVVRAHASEAGIHEQFIACTIVNDGTLDDLRDKVRSFVYSHLLSGEC